MQKLSKYKWTIILGKKQKQNEVLKANCDIQQTSILKDLVNCLKVFLYASVPLLFSAGTPCLCEDSKVGQEDERALLDTEDSRHKTCTRIPVVNFETLPGKIHTLLHFLGAGKEKKQNKTWYHLKSFYPQT